MQKPGNLLHHDGFFYGIATVEESNLNRGVSHAQSETDLGHAGSDKSRRPGSVGSRSDGRFQQDLSCRGRSHPENFPCRDTGRKLSPLVLLSVDRRKNEWRKSAKDLSLHAGRTSTEGTFQEGGLKDGCNTIPPDIPLQAVSRSESAGSSMRTL